MKPSVTLICGRSGSGKTTFAARYLLNTPADVRLVFDPDREFAALLAQPQAETLTEIDLAVRAGWCLVDPDGIWPDRKNAFDRFCTLAWAFSEHISGRKIMVVDEVWQYCDPYKIPETLAHCVQQGRKRGLETVFITQRPQRLNQSLLGQCTELVSFSLQEPRGLDALTSLGIDPAPLPSLPFHTWRAWNLLSGGTHYGTLRAPRGPLAPSH